MNLRSTTGLQPRRLVGWLAVLAVFFVLMRGGVAGLTPVETSRWGGVPLTIMLSTIEGSEW